MADKIQLRRDTEANWTSANPILAQGELGFELVTCRVKIGDGTTAWNDLDYKFQTNETVTNISITGNTITYINEAGINQTIDLSPFLQDLSNYYTITEIDTQQSSQNTNISNNSIAINAETSARALDITNLQSQITSNDTDISTNTSDIALNTFRTLNNSQSVTNLTTDIETLDNLILDNSNNITTLQTNIDTEEASRIAADITLQTNIDNEESSRIAADTALQTLITQLTYHAVVERDDPLINQTTTNENYLNQDFTLPTTGNYLCTVTVVFSHDAINSNYEGDVVIDGTTYPFLRCEPQDSAGTGIAAPNTTGGADNTGTDQRITAVFKKLLTNATGTINAAYWFESQIAGVESSTYSAVIEMKRVL